MKASGSLHPFLADFHRLAEHYIQSPVLRTRPRTFPRLVEGVQYCLPYAWHRHSVYQVGDVSEDAQQAWEQRDSLDGTRYSASYNV
ncbi:hypothetical protein E2C01_047134 [Portunus trituberculatus]|uniref:Uncharacterized protein n=1 Tax=Portunus trituberculatus TaxID=210409 RepID=A0A5B7G746_PORTR|nr:hypothetical protein [Portunus trituberculatus]